MENNNIVTINFIKESENLFHEWLLRNPDQEKIVEEAIRKSCFIKRNNSNYIFYEDPILDLIKNYNVNFFDIGMINFYSEDRIESSGNFTIVGHDGAGDPIAIDRKSNKIFSLDGDYNVVAFCSNSSEEFLQNLIKIGKANTEDWSEEDRINLAESMGDKSSEGFYLEALGVF
ncbi:hypothetical protein [Chryseobacterium caseinilyticum]|uniref:SMI1/KNR4 family protein n=1 Tax=Chryseobacterium caseinilyticum TaxID=2771428 RepID=A0ABR8ZB66_9FLAO|nr:hypothetical protein [Chryseobacterium caseinilyticum]MBD8082550.1 hypothetical protein [Chryseobacterium caseinilyticum]